MIIPCPLTGPPTPACWLTRAPLCRDWAGAPRLGSPRRPPPPDHLGALRRLPPRCLAARGSLRALGPRSGR
eukprot:620922-Pleurochrysis_carterae.AAC.1